MSCSRSAAKTRSASHDPHMFITWPRATTRGRRSTLGLRAAGGPHLGSSARFHVLTCCDTWVYPLGWPRNLFNAGHSATHSHAGPGRNRVTPEEDSPIAGREVGQSRRCIADRDCSKVSPDRRKRSRCEWPYSANDWFRGVAICAWRCVSCLWSIAGYGPRSLGIVLSSFPASDTYRVGKSAASGPAALTSGRSCETARSLSQGARLPGKNSRHALRITRGVPAGASIPQHVRFGVVFCSSWPRPLASSRPGWRISARLNAAPLVKSCGNGRPGLSV